MMVFLGILVAILVLGFIVFVHELGHFIVAKKAGILCFEFAIGMGPQVYAKKKGETVYSIRLFPIGGFVSMAGEAIENSLIKKDDEISIALNENNQVIEICFDKTVNLAISGVVLEHDLYGKDNAPLYINLSVDGQEQHFAVSPTARYLYATKKERLIAPANRCFENKNWFARLAAIVAGPLMNFLVAILLLFIVALIQRAPVNVNRIGTSEVEGLYAGDVITYINQTPTSNWTDVREALFDNNYEFINVTIIRNGQTIEVSNIHVRIIVQTLGFTNDGIENSNGQVVVGNAIGRAASAGLRQNDVITGISFDDQATTVITDWTSLLEFLRVNEGAQVRLTVLREDKTAHITYQAHSKQTFIDLDTVPILTTIEIAAPREFSWGYLFSFPFRQFGSDASQMWTTLAMLFNPQASVGVGDLTGPIGIFGMISNAFMGGIVPLMLFAAFLSVNVGILNLLPFPALDGGRILFLIIEGTTRKKIPQKVENIINAIGFGLLILLMLYVTFNDVWRLFT